MYSAAIRVSLCSISLSEAAKKSISAHEFEQALNDKRKHADCEKLWYTVCNLQERSITNDRVVLVWRASLSRDTNESISVDLQFCVVAR